MRSFLITTFLCSILLSCQDPFDQETFICENAASEYFPAREAYQQAVQEYEDLVSSGEIDPVIVSGTDVSRVDWMVNDPRSAAYVDMLGKWAFCPYLDRPERMEEYR